MEKLEKNGEVNKFESNAAANLKPLELQWEKKDRYKSLYVVYFTLFLQSLGLAIAMTGVWPYISKVDSSTTKNFYSFIVAANPLGQFIFSPLIGYWANKSSSIRWPIIASLVIFIISNALYSSLDLIDYGIKYWMIVARFFIGAASSNIAVSRSYIAGATKVDERTFALSMASLAQVSGFIAGPLLQALFTAIGDGTVFLGFHFNMYTVPGWVNVFLGFVNIALFLTSLFNDHNIAVREQMLLQGKETAKETYKTVKIDHLVVWSLIFSYFIVAFNLVILETLGTPLSMDQFAFSPKETLKWNSILVGIGAFISCVIFCLLPRVSKILKEIDILIWGGFLLAVIGKIIYIPYRNDPPKLRMVASKEYFINDTKMFYEDDDPLILGCPVSTQPWCSSSPALGIPEFVIGYFLGVIGYPVGVTLIQTLFSKILGSRPQGTWMGIMLAAGSVSRIVGPIIIVSSYTAFGTGWTFGSISIFMSFPMVLLYFLRDRLTIESPKEVENEVNMNERNAQQA